MPIEVTVVPTRLKRVPVERVPAEWQEYIEIDVSSASTKHDQNSLNETTSR